MKLWLLKYVVCLYCKKKLDLEIYSRDEDEIIEGVLKCSCNKTYSIKNGIPRMLKEEFIKGEGIEKVKAKTASSFAYEWKKFSKLHNLYEKQFLDWIYPVKKEFFKNKLVLDAGCGTGRHVFNSAKFGAKVIGVDLGDSVEVACKNTKHMENVCIVQADIYCLPFREKTFDYAYSIGVLHHLPFPQQGFNSIIKFLKINGKISAWVYGREGNVLLRIADPVRKYFFSLLPLFINSLIAYLFALVVFPVAKMCSMLSEKNRRYIPQFDFLKYLGDLNFTIIHSIIFDQMLAPIANYYTKEEFEKWFKDARLKDVIITHRNNNSWRGLGVK